MFNMQSSLVYICLFLVEIKVTAVARHCVYGCAVGVWLLVLSLKSFLCLWRKPLLHHHQLVFANIVAPFRVLSINCSPGAMWAGIHLQCLVQFVQCRSQLFNNNCTLFFVAGFVFFEAKKNEHSHQLVQKGFHFQQTESKPKPSHLLNTLWHFHICIIITSFENEINIQFWVVSILFLICCPDVTDVIFKLITPSAASQELLAVTQ